LFIAGEILGIRLLTLHNIHFYMDLVGQARTHVCDGTFTEWQTEVLQKMKALDEP
jgi:queuine tRNA-ribosyltransferase